MKRIISFALALFCVLAYPLAVSAEESARSWCVKRGKDGAAPTIDAKAEELLGTYNAYYVDKTPSDKDKVLYLTFDAGYENGNVEKILDILKEKDASAAFFVLSHIVRSAPDLISRMEKEGHLVCNHTAKHPDLTELSVEAIGKELEALETVYSEVCGKRLAPFFRPPEGRYDAKTLKTAQEKGYTTVFWSLAYADWADEVAPSDQKAEKLLKENTHNGAIILLHPTSSINVRLLGKMIDYWRSEGYRFGTLGELKQR